MSKKRTAKKPALKVTVTITMAEHDGVTADVSTSLEVDGEAWMVEAIQEASKQGALRAPFDAMTRAVLRPIGEMDLAARAYAMGVRSTRVARA